MTRKVIQVVSDRALLVLCDDGTMWQQVGSGWQQIPGPTERTLADEVVAEKLGVKP